MNTADLIPEQSQIARVQHLARERAEAQARRILWQRLLHTDNKDIHWQEFYLWLCSILEVENRIPIGWSRSATSAARELRASPHTGNSHPGIRRTLQ